MSLYIAKQWESLFSDIYSKHIWTGISEEQLQIFNQRFMDLAQLQHNLEDNEEDFY